MYIYLFDISEKSYTFIYVKKNYKDTYNVCVVYVNLEHICKQLGFKYFPLSETISFSDICVGNACIYKRQK